jgi:hypothetical protein
LLGGGLLLLLIVNIRNAWDLTLTMVQRHSGSRWRRYRRPPPRLPSRPRTRALPTWVPT